MRLFVFVVTLAIGIVAVSPVLPAQADTTPPFEIVFPQEVAETQFSSTYGAGRSGGRRHNGNDLMAPRMTEVYAVGDGTVIHVGVNRLSGRNVKIEHAEGWTSYYLHLNNDNIGTDDGRADWTLTVAPAIEVGMPVKAGQLIAWVGDSGNAEGTTPHTHFELRSNGRPINPYSILRDAFERGWHVEERLAASLVPAPGDYEIE